MPEIKPFSLSDAMTEGAKTAYTMLQVKKAKNDVQKQQTMQQLATTSVNDKGQYDATKHIQALLKAGYTKEAYELGNLEMKYKKGQLDVDQNGMKNLDMAINSAKKLAIIARNNGSPEAKKQLKGFVEKYKLGSVPDNPSNQYLDNFILSYDKTNEKLREFKLNQGVGPDGKVHYWYGNSLGEVRDFTGKYAPEAKNGITINKDGTIQIGGTKSTQAIPQANNTGVPGLTYQPKVQSQQYIPGQQITPIAPQQAPQNTQPQVPQQAPQQFPQQAPQQVPQRTQPQSSTPQVIRDGQVSDVVNLSPGKEVNKVPPAVNQDQLPKSQMMSEALPKVTNAPTSAVEPVLKEKYNRMLGQISGQQLVNSQPLDKKTLGTVNEKLFNANEAVTGLKRIRKGFKEEYLSGTEQWKYYAKEKGYKYGVNVPFMNMGDKRVKTDNAAYQAWSKDVMDNLNHYIKLITGAAMSVPEAKRIIGAMPNLKDSPDTFIKTLNSRIKQGEMAIRRYNYMLKNGYTLVRDVGTPNSATFRNKDGSVMIMSITKMEEFYNKVGDDIHDSIKSDPKYKKLTNKQKAQLVKKRLDLEFGI